MGRNASLSSNPLAERYIRAVCFNSGDRHDRMRRLFGLTWRPGDNTSTFSGKLFRPVGAAMLVAVRYETMHEGDKEYRRMPVIGFKAVAAQDGSLSYEDVCMYDGRRRPEVNARGRVICPKRNPTLLETLIHVHTTAGKQLDRDYTLPPIPTLPRVMLGFAPGRVPTYEDTPYLRQLVAEQLGVPAGRLASKDPTLLQRQMEDVWQAAIVQHDAPGNDTGLVLVDAELCTAARSALRIYEDFSHLVGVRTWNPAREVLNPTRKNPASAVLKSFDLSAEQFADPEVHSSIPMDKAEQMVAAMRRHIGGGNEMFADDDIYSGLVNPASPLVADINDPVEMIERIGPDNVVAAMRNLLQPVYSNGATREDLLTAAANPHDALFCSGTCQVQILRLQNLPFDQALDFAPEVLGRRIAANFYRPWATPRPETAAQPIAEVTHVQTVAPEGEPAVPAA